MIYDKPDDYDINDWKFSINIGRPTMFEEKHFVFWEKLHNWIKTSEILICPNGTFGLIEDYIEKRQGYGGSGFQYRFWFKTKEDAKVFQDFLLQNGWYIGTKHTQGPHTGKYMDGLAYFHPDHIDMGNGETLYCKIELPKEKPPKIDTNLKIEVLLEDREQILEKSLLVDFLNEGIKQQLVRYFGPKGENFKIKIDAEYIKKG